MILLLVITFVFGVVKLISHTKLFDNHLVGIIHMFSPTEEMHNFFHYLDILFFYFSIAFQSWFWIFRHVEF
jgi:hypothetical protein